MSSSAQDAVTKYYSLDALNNRLLFLTAMEAGKSTVKVPLNLVPDETALAACQRHPSHYVLTKMTERERDRETEREREMSIVLQKVASMSLFLSLQLA